MRATTSGCWMPLGAWDMLVVVYAEAKGHMEERNLLIHGHFTCQRRHAARLAQCACFPTRSQFSSLSRYRIDVAVCVDTYFGVALPGLDATELRFAVPSC